MIFFVEERTTFYVVERTTFYVVGKMFFQFHLAKTIVIENGLLI